MHLGYFTDFKSHSHLVLLSGGSADFASLRSRMAELSADVPLSVHELEGMNPVCDTALEIRISRRARITHRGLSSFEWELTADALVESLDKIAMLSSESHSCHQFFNCHPSDDAIIMIAVGEYDDLWWDRVATQQRTAAEFDIPAESP